MDPKQERQRRYYIADIPGLLLYGVNKHRIESKQNAIWQLCMDNQSMLGCRSNTFVYESQFYTAGDSIKRRDMPNRELHPKLRPVMKEIMEDDDFEQRIEDNKLSHYFDQLVIATGNLADLSALLPWQLHSLLDQVNPDIFNIRPPMSKAELDEFKERNIIGVRCITELYIKKLLLQGAT